MNSLASLEKMGFRVRLRVSGTQLSKLAIENESLQ